MQVHAKKSVAVISDLIYRAILEAILLLCKGLGEGESRCNNEWFLGGDYRSLWGRTNSGTEMALVVCLLFDECGIQTCSFPIQVAQKEIF